ncbi:putative Cytochrome c oxidase subunit 6A, mitochondrial [Glarea lozoyensis 74030]|uniref:Putative Cytochrome c oxidase subunit 6A, mitochondrial n=1 Tax=Glarea lozoyensis (strain ATCC 74030 / MF5533) TaxID=1104152 RepID=H0EZM8_GLAL7|nr:putative Cytochrome c oxidase subunit 6A, mitochondrial [Glarea lozoyensis 74030]
MFPQRQMIRTSQRFAANLRSPSVRTPFQRRFASHGESTLKGVEDNAFNREREAVKAHAAATSGVNAYVLWNEHWDHWAHKGPLEERTEYDYQNLRTKNYFWGDGDKTIFWNDKVNYHKKDDE